MEITQTKINLLMPTLQNTIKEISPRGNGKTIKTNKPKDGRFAYIWRMARFYAGHDTSMPFCAYFDLMGALAKIMGVDWKELRPFEKETVKAYDAFVQEVLEAMGLGKLQVLINPDGTVTAKGNSNSLTGMAVYGNCESVNKLSLEELVAVYVVARDFPYVSDRSIAFSKALEAVKAKGVTSLGDKVTIGDLRKAIVAKIGGSFGSPIDAYLTEAVKLNETKGTK